MTREDRGIKGLGSDVRSDVLSLRRFDGIVVTTRSTQAKTMRLARWRQLPKRTIGLSGCEPRCLSCCPNKPSFQKCASPTTHCLTISRSNSFLFDPEGSTPLKQNINDSLIQSRDQQRSSQPRDPTRQPLTSRPWMKKITTQANKQENVITTACVKFLFNFSDF